MKSFQVIRTHVSPYQKHDFFEQEKTLISGLRDCDYRLISEFEIRPTILVTNTHTELQKLPREILNNTKLIIHPNSGYDNFSSDHDLWKSIPVVIGHRIRAQAVAEYSLRSLMEGMIEIPNHLRWDADRKWERKLLKGTSVFIFGHGHIGKILSRTLLSLGMKVTVVDPFEKDCLKKWQDGNIKEAKVIIAALGLNPLSHKVFNQEFFESLGEEVVFINGARGKLVDEKALKGYLLSHPRSFAFLDVFEKEPFGEEWIGFPQVWKTSHIAGVDADLDQKILDFEKEVLISFCDLSTTDFSELYAKELLQNKWKNGVLI